MARRSLAFVLVALVACGGRAGPSSGSSGVAGRVLAGPTCPVETVDSPCPPRPMQTEVAVESVDGQDLRSVRTDEGGSFRIALAPGAYLLTPRPPPGDPTLTPRPTTVRVERGRFVRVTLILDTGLRAS